MSEFIEGFLEKLEKMNIVLIMNSIQNMMLKKV